MNYLYRPRPPLNSQNLPYLVSGCSDELRVLVRDEPGRRALLVPH